MAPRLPRASALLMVGGVLVLVVCITGGCSRSAGSGGSHAGTTATAAPSAAVVATRLSVRDDLVDARVVDWRAWRVVNATTLEFTVTAGPADCYGSQPEVVESGNEVRVRLRIGRLPEAADRECAAIAVESVVLVRLASPLGTRRVSR